MASLIDCIDVGVMLDQQKGNVDAKVGAGIVKRSRPSAVSRLKVSTSGEQKEGDVPMAATSGHVKGRATMLILSVQVSLVRNSLAGPCEVASRSGGKERHASCRPCCKISAKERIS